MRRDEIGWDENIRTVGIAERSKAQALFPRRRK